MTQKKRGGGERERRTLRIQVRYRRFAFAFGDTFAAVKEYRSERSPAPIASFAVALDDKREPREIRKLVKAEILKRLTR